MEKSRIEEVLSSVFLIAYNKFEQKYGNAVLRNDELKNEIARTTY